MNKYKIICVRGHYEVYQNGQFLFSADTYEEAEEDIVLTEVIEDMSADYGKSPERVYN